MNEFGRVRTNPQQQKWYVLMHISTNGKYHSYNIRTNDFIGHSLHAVRNRSYE